MQHVSATAKVICLVLLHEMVSLFKKEQLQVAHKSSLVITLFMGVPLKYCICSFLATPSNLYLGRKHTACTLPWALEWPLAQSQYNLTRAEKCLFFTN